MSDRYTHYQHAVGGSTWHLEWCTKFRYKLFNKEYLKTLCMIGLEESARRHGLQIEIMDVQPDHVHTVVHVPLQLSPLQAIKYLKGFSSWMLFKEKPKLRLLYPKGSLWSPGKYIASVGDVDINYAIAYVKNQSAHHAKSINRNPRPVAKRRGRPAGRGFSPRRMSIYMNIWEIASFAICLMIR
ncbi:MAG: IS200/IS605 family transposase [archaeon]